MRRRTQDGRDQGADTGGRLRHASASAHVEPAEAARRVRQQADDTPSDRSSGHGRRTRGKLSCSRHLSRRGLVSGFRILYARDFNFYVIGGMRDTRLILLYR